MEKTLARRVKKLEETAPHLPCHIPEHQTLRVFIYGQGPEQDAENDRLIESMDACPQCRNKQKVLITHFEKYIPERATGGEEAPLRLNITSTDGETLTIGDCDGPPALREWWKEQ